MLCFGLTSNAQSAEEKENKISITGTADGSLFQLALLEIGGQSELSTLRYSYFFNGGTQVNVKLNEKLTFFSGLTIKNIGFIYKGDTNTFKYRVYAAGIPLGLKIGNLKSNYFIIGGGIDFPFNYKEKQWGEKRGENKKKDDEWFSNKVNPIMPYTSLGYRFGNALTVKAMYYPLNFWNTDKLANPNNSANLLILSLGFDIKKGTKGVEVDLPSRKNK